MRLFVITVYAFILLNGENSEVEFDIVAVVVISEPKSIPTGKGIVNVNMLVLSVLPSTSVYKEMFVFVSSTLPSILVVKYTWPSP